MNNIISPITKPKPPRESNLELLRILAMLAIIAHHFVVNSGVTKEFNGDYITPNAMFLTLWGMWGKTAINSFILISGWFLCTSHLTWQKILTLWIEVKFYRVLIFLIFVVSGYEIFSFNEVKNICFENLIGVNHGFVASFLAFYIFVPLYNKLIHAMTKREHLLLITGLLLYFTIASTFLFARSMNEPFWYMALYLIAAYMRLYPARWSTSLRFSWILLSASVLLAYISVAYLILFRWEQGIAFHYYFISDSNKLLALTGGVGSFLVAKNSSKFVNKKTNTIAAGCFGVLLIHASSNTMRHWLWQDIVNVPNAYHFPIGLLVIYSIIVPILIFLICTTVDYFRRKYIEEPFMGWLYKYSNKIENLFRNKLNII